ncbi:MAG: hypothetical protein QM696_09550 [Steroidobacteraceae bacterium]
MKCKSLHARVAILACSAALTLAVQAAETGRFSQFDGIWNKSRGSLRYSQDPPFTPAARAKFESLRPQDDPGARCTESGTPRIMISPYPMEIVARDTHILLVSEFNHVVRRIWTDTKEHDPDADPSFYGDTVVHWEGDMMVVDSVSFNGVNYLDPAGDPMSANLHLVERWRLTDPDTLQIEFTFDDPDNYTRPWKSVQTYKRQPRGFKLGEFSCTENNRNNPDDPNNPKSLTSTDTPQPYERKKPQ